LTRPKSLAIAVALAAGFAPSAWAQCVGDLTHDGAVNGADLGLLLSDWGGCTACAADLDRNGSVDGSDLGTLLGVWGACPSPIVPAWASLVEAQPDPSVITDPAIRAAIVESGMAWRVRHQPTQIELLLIPAGTFQMGCTPMTNGWCWLEESPVHQVTFSGPIYMGRYEVTQAQWTQVMGANPSQFQGPSYPNSALRPVERLNWNDTLPFLAATGMRLPTESEWEYASRAGTVTAFHGTPTNPAGGNNDAALAAVAWIGMNSGMQTQPIGLKPANGFGLHDMAGNVMEWASDWLGPYPATPQVDPAGPASGWGRVFRGGCWHLYPDLCRVSVRFEDQPDGQRYSDTGMRAARDP